MNPSPASPRSGACAYGSGAAQMYGEASTSTRQSRTRAAPPAGASPAPRPPPPAAWGGALAGGRVRDAAPAYGGADVEGVHPGGGEHRHVLAPQPAAHE